MNTNTLNKHLENKSTEDITKMVNEILDIFDKYDEEYDIRNEDFYLLQIDKYRSSENFEVVYKDKLFKINNIRDMLRNMFKERYFDRILKTRTENLLKKVELLD